MNGGIVVVRKIDSAAGLPAHAWKNDTGRGSGRMEGSWQAAGQKQAPKPGQMGIARENAAGKVPKAAAPLSRKEADAWCARLLDANTALDNHSC